MSEDVGFLGRIGRWFRRRFSPGDDLPLLNGDTETSTSLVRRTIFPWQRREEDFSSLQNGLASMSALMNSLRQYLDQQSARHDELLNYLSQLSQALQAIPDSGRVQGETLRVLHQQIAFQNAQHKQLSEMLRKVAESSGTQQEIAETLRERVETLYKNDEQVAETIRSMSDSVLVVSQQSQTNTLVLDRLRDNLVNRDGALEQAIRRENRWTRSTLLIVAATALTALLISIAMALYSWSAISSVAESVQQNRVVPQASPAADAAQRDTPDVEVPAEAPAPANVAPEAGQPAQDAGDAAQAPEPPQDAAPAEAGQTPAADPTPPAEAQPQPVIP